MNWTDMKVVGVFLFLVCALTLVLDLVPHDQAKKIGMALSWISWPLFILWTIGVLVKGFM